MKAILRWSLAWLLIAAGAAQAAVIYDNQGAPVDNGLFNDPNASQFIADDFILAPGASIITDVHWTGGYAFSNSPTTPDNFTIQIFLDNGSGAPVIAPFASLPIGNPGRTDTGIDVVGLGDLYRYSVNTPPIMLLPNTPYWLSIVNDTTADSNDDWFWGGRVTGSSSDSFAVRSNQAAPWSTVNGFRLDFQLTNDALNGAVPEPDTLALFAIALLLLSFLRRRY